MTRPHAPARAFENLLGALLLAAAVASAVCLAAGLGIWLIDHDAAAAAALLNAGLIVLMGAPILRIAIAIVESIRLRDWLFVASTLVVAAVLCATLVLTLLKPH